MVSTSIANQRAAEKKISYRLNDPARRMRAFGHCTAGTHLRLVNLRVPTKYSLMKVLENIFTPVPHDQPFGHQSGWH
jgi:hypothetical protein